MPEETWRFACFEILRTNSRIESPPKFTNAPTSSSSIIPWFGTGWLPEGARMRQDGAKKDFTMYAAANDQTVLLFQFRIKCGNACGRVCGLLRRIQGIASSWLRVVMQKVPFNERATFDQSQETSTQSKSQRSGILQEGGLEFDCWQSNEAKDTNPACGRLA